MKKKITIILFSLWLFANSIYAATFTEVIKKFSDGIIGTLTKLAIVLAVVFFFWGIFMFIFNADDQAKREEGKKRVIWGVVAIFVMSSIWGIMGVLKNTTKLNNTHNIKIELK